MSPNWATRCHSSGSACRTSSQRITSSKYRSAITELSSSAATARSGFSATSGRLVNMAVARQGRSRPFPPPASSTRPYLASWRRWKDVLAELSPSSSAARVAVSGPSTRSSPTRDSRIGWARARRARGSRSRVTERFAGRPSDVLAGGSAAVESAAAGSSVIDANIALQRVLGRYPGRYAKLSLHETPTTAADGFLAESPPSAAGPPGRATATGLQGRRSGRDQRSLARRDQRSWPVGQAGPAKSGP